MGPFYGTLRVTNLEDLPVYVSFSWTSKYDDHIPPLQRPVAPHATITYHPGLSNWGGTGLEPGSGMVVSAYKQTDFSPANIIAALKQAGLGPVDEDGRTSSDHTTVDGYTGFTGDQIGTEAVVPIVHFNSNWATLLRATNFDFTEETTVKVTFHEAGGGEPLGPFEEVVAPGKTLTIDPLVWGIPTGWVGSAKLEAETDIGVVAERYKAETQMHMFLPGMAFEIPGTDFYFASLIFADHFGWNTGISAANLSADPVQVSMCADGFDPLEIPEYPELPICTELGDSSLAGHGIGYYHLPGTDVQLPWPTNAGEFEAEQPVRISLDQVKYRSDTEFGQAMTYVVRPEIAEPQQSHTYPIFQKGDPHTGMGDTSGVQVFNPTDQSVQFTYTFFDDDGVLQIGVLEPISLAPKTGMTFYSMDIEELPAGFSGSMIIDVVGESGGLVSVLNKVNYAVDGDGSTAYTPVTFSQPVAIEDPGTPTPPVIPYYGQ